MLETPRGIEAVTTFARARVLILLSLLGAAGPVALPAADVVAVR